MSYEGYEQHVCANGHLWQQPAHYAHDESEVKCSYCEANSVFCNSVDDTNCEEYGIIPKFEWDKLLKSPKEVETCNLGHVHVIKEAIYNLPSDVRGIQWCRINGTLFRLFDNVREQDRHFFGVPKR